MTEYKLCKLCNKEKRVMVKPNGFTYLVDTVPKAQGSYIRYNQIIEHRCDK